MSKIQNLPLSKQLTNHAEKADKLMVLLPSEPEVLRDWARKAGDLEAQIAQHKKMYENLTNRVVQAIGILVECAQTNYDGQPAASVGLRAYEVLVTKDPSDG